VRLRPWTARQAIERGVGVAALVLAVLGPAIFSGRVPGGWAAHEAGFGPGFGGKANRSE